MMLARSKIPTRNVNILDSKRIYVIELLKNQPNEIILKIANDLELTTFVYP